MRFLIAGLLCLLVAGCRGTPEQPAFSEDGGIDLAADSGSAPDSGPVAAPLGTTLTTVELVDESGGAVERTGLPVTFAQVFAPGDVPAGARVAARLADGSGVQLPGDAKANHADGSLRHAGLTVLLPPLPAGGSRKVELLATNEPASGQAPVAASELLATSFDAVTSLRLVDGGVSASAKDLLSQDATHRWLEGPLVTEHLLAAPVKNGTTAHPHLTARFAVRAYAGGTRARVDVMVDNDWAHAPGPQNFTYDAEVAIAGQSVWAKPALKHLHHARWRKTFWFGGDPQVGVREEIKYLLDSGAVPHFDPSLKMAESALVALATKGTAEPMEIGLATAYMPQTGGRRDIGPAPSWVATYLLSMDPRARRAMLATADGSGS
jgi:hypothetical protein